MRLCIFTAAALLCACVTSGFGQTIFINEIDYDQPGPLDTDEFIELAGTAGASLNGWTLELVNGATNTVYQTIALPNFTFSNTTNTGWGFFVLGRAPISPDYDFLVDDFIQNGPPDGIRLLDASSNVVHFVSYEGAMPGANDVVPGTVFDNNSIPGSIGLTGVMSTWQGSTWTFFTQPSLWLLNSGQDLLTVPEPALGSILGFCTCLLLRRRSA